MKWLDKIIDKRVSEKLEQVRQQSRVEQNIKELFHRVADVECLVEKTGLSKTDDYGVTQWADLVLFSKYMCEIDRRLAFHLKKKRVIK